MAESPPLHAVLLAGGGGTRFWPASRRARPKQFLSLAAGGRTMIAETAARLEGCVLPERVLVVAPAEQAGLVRAALPDLPRENLLLEPEGRNTGPCVAWAAHELARRAPESLQVVLPADHVLAPVEAFRAALEAAAGAAAGSSALHTFGIRPTHAATGFGWIEAGEELARVGGHAVHAVRRFVEKPDRQRAEAFLAAGSFLWNSGMFVWRTDAIAAAVREHFPEAHEALAAHDAGLPLAEAYARMPRRSIDVAVLERARDVRVVPVDFAWSDVGSWSALPEVLEADAAGNVVAGGARLVAEGAEGCVVHGEPGTITALIGVRDLVVVRSGDALLVCPRERAQEVRRLVERLGREPGGEAFL